MAINSPNKRASAGNITWIIVYPLPDGQIDDFDREQATGLYGGIAPTTSALPQTRSNKRASAGNTIPIIIYPFPDGTIDDSNRQQATGLYAGIPIELGVTPEPEPEVVAVSGGGPERIRRKRYPEVYITSTEFEDEDIVIILN